MGLALKLLKFYNINYKIKKLGEIVSINNKKWRLK